MDLEHLKALCEKATKGPWKFWDNRGKVTSDALFRPLPPLGETHQGVLIADRNVTSTVAADSEFIAAAREALPKLIEEVEEDRAAIRAYRKQHNHEFRDVVDCESGVCACYICLEHATAIARAQGTSHE